MRGKETGLPHICQYFLSDFKLLFLVIDLD